MSHHQPQRVPPRGYARRSQIWNGRLVDGWVNLLLIGG